MDAYETQRNPKLLKSFIARQPYKNLLHLHLLHLPPYSLPWSAKLKLSALKKCVIFLYTVHCVSLAAFTAECLMTNKTTWGFYTTVDNDTTTEIRHGKRFFSHICIETNNSLSVGAFVWHKVSTTFWQKECNRELLALASHSWDRVYSTLF